MKVLHINTEKTWRGGERQIELLTNYGLQKFHSIIACHPHGQLRNRLSGQHEVVDLHIRNGFDFTAAFRLKNLSKQVDLIHCHTPKAQSVAILAKYLGCKKPVICTKRTSFRIGENFFSKLKYRQTDQVVCVSNASAQTLKGQLPQLNPIIISSAIERVKNINPELIEHIYPKTRGRLKIGYVAALTEEKNPQGFIKTAQTVLTKRNDCCFLWIGDGELKPEIQAQVDSLNLSDRVFLTGFQKNIRSWIAALDLLFFPSLSEGFPTTILESMQLHVPVVASDIPGIREIIQNGKNGLLCDPSDPIRFAEKIKEVFLSDANRKSLITNAKDQLQGSFAEDMVTAYLDVYNTLTSKT